MINSAPSRRYARKGMLSVFGRGVWRVLFICCGLSLGPAAPASGAFLQIRNGYFWDPATADYFVPRGIAYQTWNPPVGANQSYEQMEYDLVEFKKMYANSVRCEMVWNEVETSPGHFEWGRPDFLVQKAEELGLKLFVLIGFQYAPDWFPQDWKALNDQNSNSVVLAYENPDARLAYSNFIAQVTSRYKNSPAIGAWILGNEYAYFDLWEPSRRFLGYDPYSLASFRTYLSGKYGGNISALNSTWGTNYASFNVIPMARTYPADRHDPGYHDLIQWRKKSIGGYVALGATAARLADANHLRTYSMVGGLFGEADIHFTCEDARTIVSSCAAAGAPLDFWAVNNYAIASLGNELRSADFGIAKHQAASGLPVLISETGHTSTEDIVPDAGARQAAALPTQMWEALMSGAIGVHIFTWNERDLFAGNYFPREKGFGIVHQNRLVKEPVYSNVVETFRRMEQLQPGRLLGGTTNPAPDIQFFWSQNTDMGWPRANHNNIRLWSALKRLGFQPRIIHDEEFESGAWTAAPVLLLSRGYQMDPRHLDVIVSNVIPAGIHVHADADLPGQYNAYHKPNPRWVQHMGSLFGLNVTSAAAAWDAGAIDPFDLHRRLNFTGITALGPLTNGYSDYLGTWKIWHGLTTSSGTTIVTDTGLNGTQAPVPALHLKTIGAAKTAINTFALGDSIDLSDQVPPHNWDLRYNWLRAIYRNHFNLTPRIDLSGAGASYVFPDYRFCPNGSVLIGLFNGHTNSASITLAAPTLLLGKTVENLTSGGIIETNSDGVVALNLAGDQYVLLYAYAVGGAADQSLLASAPQKLWIEAAPMAVWPTTNGADLTIGFDTQCDTVNLGASLERVLSPNKVYGQASSVSISGRSNVVMHLSIPDADLNDVDYVSSRDGGRYVFHVWLEKNGTRLSEIFLGVRLLWAVRPLSLPSTVVPGNTYQVTLAWQELPSYKPAEFPTPLSRADFWELLKSGDQAYDVVLELQANGSVVASDHFLTSTGTDSHTFSVTVPPGAQGPFHWLAYLRASPGSSHDVIDGFETQRAGDDPALTNPWQSYFYSESNNVMWVAQGVGTNGVDANLAYNRSQAAFVIVQNPPNPGRWAGFGIVYDYPAAWSLPSDLSRWSNYTFSCDFQEAAQHRCVLELQVKDDLGGAIRFTKPCVPGLDGWDRIRARLDQFTIVTDGFPFTGHFNLARVKSLVVNIQILDTNARYAGSFDNIRFDGPEQAKPAGASRDVFDSFEDRLLGEGAELINPWSTYIYPGGTNIAFLNTGVDTNASDGLQSAWMLVKNPANPPGNSWGFGMYYSIAPAWALPPDRNAWTNYVFSFDFREASSNACQIEMQVKSGVNNWIEFTKIYTPGPHGWDTIRANLGQFVQAPGVGTFDSNHVETLTLNIRMLKTNATYLGSFDNVRFDGPETPFPPELGYGLFTSDNDSLADSDRDGIPDIYETGTGVYVSPTNTGTNPNKADTDGDGLGDRFELIAGTDPNVAGDVFRIQDIRRNSDGSVVLSWQARTNKVYGVRYLDGNLFDGAQFYPLEGLNGFTVASNGLFQTVDPSAAGVGQRFYRITVQNP